MFSQRVPLGTEQSISIPSELMLRLDGSQLQTNSLVSLPLDVIMLSLDSRLLLNQAQAKSLLQEWDSNASEMVLNQQTLFPCTVSTETHKVTGTSSVKISQITLPQELLLPPNFSQPNSLLPLTSSKRLVFQIGLNTINTVLLFQILNSHSN